MLFQGRPRTIKSLHFCLSALLRRIRLAADCIVLVSDADASSFFLLLSVIIYPCLQVIIIINSLENKASDIKLKQNAKIIRVYAELL